MPPVDTLKEQSGGAAELECKEPTSTRHSFMACAANHAADFITRFGRGKDARTVSQLARGNRAGRDCFRSARTSALAWGHCVVSRHAPLLSRMWIRFVRLFIHVLLLWVPVVRGFGLPTFAMLCGRPRLIFSCASPLRWSTSSYKAQFLSLFAPLYVARP